MNHDIRLAVDCFDYEAITVSSTAVGFTATKIRPTTGNAGQATMAFVTVETDQVRYRADGTDPTSSQGHLLQVGDTLTLHGQADLQKVRFIRVTTDATLRVSYYH